MTVSRFSILSVLTVLSFSAMLGCGSGGGGGGDEFIGAALVTAQASPERIDSGDRTEVRIQISSVHKNGIALKIRFPKGLDYVNSSSFIDIEDSEIDVTPTVNQGKESEVYLVYYITAEMLGRREEGTLFFELEGKDSVDEGSIEVDPDVDDPAIDNAVEFNIDEPQFGAEDQVSIEVTD